MSTNARPRQQHACPPEPVQDWTELHRNDQVELCLDGTVVAAGHIDLCAADGRVFWLLPNNAGGRTMISKDEGISVYRKPRT